MLEAGVIGVLICSLIFHQKLDRFPSLLFLELRLPLAKLADTMTESVITIVFK